MTMIQKKLNISDFLCGSLESCKKFDMFIHKECDSINECFTTDNNLGYLSDKHFDTFEQASANYKNVGYSNLVYSTFHNNSVYLSYNDFYNPILTRRIARQETDDFIIYRYLIIDNKGKLLQSVLISKINKKCKQ
jgi:hypothetical protein